MDDEGVPSTAIREIAALMELKHPNIVELIEVLNNGSELYLVFEYMDQDLRHYMDHVTTDTISPLLVKVHPSFLSPFPCFFSFVSFMTITVLLTWDCWEAAIVMCVVFD